MSDSPTSILARLEELKKWQEKQQERLLQQHQRRLEQNERNYAIGSDSESTGRPSLDSSVRSCRDKAKNDDDQFVSPRKSLHELLEENVTSDTREVSVSNKPKRPYLRKGTGLIRFRLNPGEQYKPFKKGPQQEAITKKVNTKPTTSATRKQQSIQQEQQVNTKKPVDARPKTKTHVETAPLKVPQVGVKAKWCNVITNSDNKDNSAQNHNERTGASLKPSLFPHNSDTDLKIKKTNKCNALTSNQNIITQINEFAAKHFSANANKQYSDLVESSSNPSAAHYGLQETVYAPQNSTSNCVTPTPGDLTLYENALEQELLVFEALEQRAMHNSFCSTNSSVVRLLASTPNKHSPTKSKNHVNIVEIVDHFVAKNGTQAESHRPKQTHEMKQAPQQCGSKQMKEGPLDRPTGNVMISSDEDIRSSNSSVTSEDLNNYVQEPFQAKNFQDTEKWSDVPDNFSITSSSCCEGNIDEHPTAGKKLACDVATMTENSDRIEEEDEGKLNEHVLTDKLQELENEIKGFRIENAKISRLKQELEIQQKEFKKEKKELINSIEQERVQINFRLEEEKKRLAKEKMVFERYVKDIQNRPSKKDREELGLLKTEVANLKETLKLKETRNGMAQARLRNQIKSLEKENSSLKTEIEQLNKQNARLLANQKLTRKPSDTKMLHEINRNLTRLSRGVNVAEQLKKINKTVDKQRASLDASTSNADDSSDASENEYKNKLTRCTSKRRRHRKITGSNGSETQSTPVLSCPIEDHNLNHLQEQINTNDSLCDHRRTSYESPSKQNNSSRRDSKENDPNATNVQNYGCRNDTKLSLEEDYARMFGNGKNFEVQLPTVFDADKNKLNERVERLLSDGSRELKYSNGNLKTISSDGNFIYVKHYNGDIKETNLLDGVIRYYYVNNKIWHTTYNDGTELLEFADGLTEKRYKDGSCEIRHPDGIVRFLQNNTEKLTYPDGTTVTIDAKGERTLNLPNGQKEVHTENHMRREYPDGTVKILYPDGLQETRYANGRLRIKDKEGKLLMDSYDNT